VIAEALITGTSAGAGPPSDYFMRCPALERGSPEGRGRAAVAWIDSEATGFASDGRGDGWVGDSHRLRGAG